MLVNQEFSRYLGVALVCLLAFFAFAVLRSARAAGADPRQLADFAGFGHYAAANAVLPAAEGARRVVFMGDSITENWGKLDAQFFVGDYVNRGISGQTTTQMLLRFRRDVVALKPAVVHLMAGTNDLAGNTGDMTLEDIEANLASMIDIAEANHITVVLGAVLPTRDFPWSRGREPGPKVAALNEWIARYAKAHGLRYADYYAAVTDGRLGIRNGLSSDGVHPTQAGYALMDPIAKREIEAALASR